MKVRSDLPTVLKRYHISDVFSTFHKSCFCLDIFFFFLFFFFPFCVCVCPVRRCNLSESCLIQLGWLPWYSKLSGLLMVLLLFNVSVGLGMRLECKVYCFMFLSACCNFSASWTCLCVCLCVAQKGKRNKKTWTQFLLPHPLQKK